MLAIGILTVLFLIPVLLIVIISLTKQEYINQFGYSFFPGEWSFDAYKYVFKFGDQLFKSYIVTIYETVMGTLLTLLFCGMFAYTLSRRQFVLRKFFNVMLVITMVFNGGMVASYIVNVNIYNMQNNLLVLILPTCINTYNCIVLRSYIDNNVPDAIIESAYIDGANEYYTYFGIVLPIMKPVLAALGFMLAVQHWNQWNVSYLYINRPELATLQQMLIKIEKNMDFLKNNMGNLSAEQVRELKNMPTDSARMATLMCTLVPIMVIYPFFQKYFITGLTVVAVKG